MVLADGRGRGKGGLSMSLGSDYPEKLDKAMNEAIARHIVGASLRTWHTSADEERMIEDIEYALEETSDYIRNFLMDLPGVGSNGLERFHESFRGRED